MTYLNFRALTPSSVLTESVSFGGAEKIARSIECGTSCFSHCRVGYFSLNATMTMDVISSDVCLLLCLFVSEPRDLFSLKCVNWGFWRLITENRNCLVALKTQHFRLVHEESLFHQILQIVKNSKSRTSLLEIDNRKLIITVEIPFFIYKIKYKRSASGTLFVLPALRFASFAQDTGKCDGQQRNVARIVLS